jgi:hypothetical protein
MRDHGRMVLSVVVACALTGVLAISELEVPGVELH